MVRFITVVENRAFNRRVEGPAGAQFTLEELWINQDTVVKISAARGHQQLLRDGLMSPDLDQNHSFTSVTLNNCGVMETHVVVGDPGTVAASLNKNNSRLLKG